MHLTIVQMLIRKQFPGLLVVMLTLFVINIIKVIWKYSCAADWRLVPTLSIFFGSVNEKDGEAGEEVALRAKPGFILR